MANKLLTLLNEAKTVAISGHVRPDGDCVGACMAMYHYVKAHYKATEVSVFLEPIADSYKVIEDTEKIITDSSADKSFDLFISLDCGDKERLGRFAKYFDASSKTIDIDHHISNVYFGDENIVFPKASSTCEVLADLFEGEIFGECAKALYMGMMCDTGCFKYTNTSRHTMEVAGSLIEKGVHTEQMMDEVFFAKTYMQQKLLGECLLSSVLYLNGRVIVAKASRELMAKYSAAASDFEGVIDQLRLVKGTQAAILLTENTDGSWKLSMRSRDKVNVSEIAVSFGGGGHIKAAGATITGPVDACLSQVIEKIEEQLKNND